jgi:hypothetical protein
LLSPSLVVLAAGVAGLSGVLGWRRGTRFLHRRSLSEPNLPPGMTRRAYDRRLRRRRKVQRMAMTALYVLAGAAVGAFFIGVMPR